VSASDFDSGYGCHSLQQPPQKRWFMMETFLVFQCEASEKLPKKTLLFRSMSILGDVTIDL
jgi:hypothetical protein